MACDNLECMKCRYRVLSWSHAILCKLNIGHQVQFTCILTAKLACDMKVVHLLPNRELGNRCSQIQKSNMERSGYRMPFITSQTAVCFLLQQILVCWSVQHLPNHQKEHLYLSVDGSCKFLYKMIFNDLMK